LKRHGAADLQLFAERINPHPGRTQQSQLHFEPRRLAGGGSAHHPVLPLGIAVQMNLGIPQSDLQHGLTLLDAGDGIQAHPDPRHLSGGGIARPRQQLGAAQFQACPAQTGIGAQPQRATEKLAELPFKPGADLAVTLAQRLIGPPDPGSCRTQQGGRRQQGDG
jgi:hypothetical protein